MQSEILVQYKKEMEAELASILLYWMDHTVDHTHGGFIGKIDHHNHLYPDAPKGVVLNSRILWTFAAAARRTGSEAYWAMAHRAFGYLAQHFFDAEHGGVYWTLTAEGQPLDTKKQIYAQAFALYALSEYHRLCGDPKALDLAIDLYRVVERHSHDPQHGGYLEARGRAWQPLEDLRLSEKDANEQKSMNTHLHVLEGYANLYCVWPDAELRHRIVSLIHIFLNHIIDADTHHLVLFFDERWQPRSTAISYGHDIEAAWLVQEAAEVVGAEALLRKVKERSLLVAEAAARGLDADGGLWYEKDGDHLVAEKHWWPQAEAMVGFFNAWQLSGDPVQLERSVKCWEFVKAHILDRDSGEWVWGVRADYSMMQGEDKAGIWKCPYHNGRACIEVAERIGRQLEHSPRR